MSSHLLSYDLDVGKHACDLTCPLTYYLGATAVGLEARYPKTNDDLFHCLEEDVNPSLKNSVVNKISYWIFCFYLVLFVILLILLNSLKSKNLEQNKS